MQIGKPDPMPAMPACRRIQKGAEMKMRETRASHRRFTQFGMSGKGLVQTSAIAVLAAALAGCAGHVPGRQTYWDEKIKEMCEKEGRVQVFEQVVLTKSEANMMPRVDGKISTRAKGRESIGDPVYSERTITYLKEADPRVAREEVKVIRRLDQKIVAQWVEYARVGGDIPTGIAHDSSFRCPDPRKRLEELQRLFVVRED